MFSILTPDLIAPSSVSVSPYFLYSRGIRGLILDIDNTLVTYDDPEPTPLVLEWFSKLDSLGIRVAFVSNNNAQRVERFNASLGYIAFSKAGKPLRRSMDCAIAALGLPKSKIAMIGDQLFTDVLAGKRSGLFTILVPPIQDKRDLFTRFKRLCERPFLALYRKHRTKRPAIKLAVLGSPIAHSLSPVLHQALAQRCNVNVEYTCIETAKEELSSRIEWLREQGYHGWNCTMPLKTEMATLCTHRSDNARRLQSVNTVLPLENGFYGDSTDGAGILHALAHHGVTVTGKRVVLLGAGGAARSIADAMITNGATLTVLNRTEKIFDGILARKWTDQSLRDACQKCDILIQATSLGMAGQAEFSDLSFVDVLPAHAVVVDAVYHPTKTALLQCAAARSLTTVDGLWMLLYQGIDAFALFCGVTPSKEDAQFAHDVLQEQIQAKGE